jgi:hypothetical protein
MGKSLLVPGSTPLVTALFILCLPGLVVAMVFLAVLPAALVYLLGLPVVAGAVLLPLWWYVLARYASTLMVLVTYFAPVFAVLGWIVLFVGLRRAGLF